MIDQRAPDEWYPPPLSTPFPFPFLAVIGVGMRDGVTVALAALIGNTTENGFSMEPWFPTTQWHWAWVGFCVVYILNAVIHPQGRRLLSWTLPWLRHLILVVLVSRAWGGRDAYRAARAYYKISGRLTVLLPRAWASLVHADVRVVGPGIIDVSGTLGPAWWRWLFCVVRRQDTLRGLIWLSLSGSLDLIDSEELIAVWQNRLALLADPGHSMSFHVLVRPFPPDLLAQCAGPVAEEARILAETMVRRELLMAVPASTRKVLNKRLLALIGTGSGEENGVLASAGLDSRMLSEQEAQQLVDEAYGLKGPAIWYSPNQFAIETGSADPPPLSANHLAETVQSTPGKGWVGYRTFVISNMPSRVRVGWTHPVTGGSVLANWSMHLDHLPRWQTEGILGLKSAAWGALKVGAKRYERIAALTDQTIALSRAHDTAIYDVSMYVSVPETQLADATLAMERMVGRENFYLPTLYQQKARQSAEPFGRDPYHQKWWGEAHTMGAGWPSSGGIYVPGGVLIGKCARSDEPIVWNSRWEGDETSVGCILGGSGSGKTNAEQVIAAEMMLPAPGHPGYGHGVPCVVAYYKPFDEWAEFCRVFKGEHYHPTDLDWRDLLRKTPVGHTPIVAFNLISLGTSAQVDFLRTLSDRVMEVQEESDFIDPLLYIVGEAWLMVKQKEGAEHLQQMALQVRTLGITLLVDSQFADHLYRSEAARDVIRGASMWMLLRLNKSERRDLSDLLDISPIGMNFLAQVAQPQTLSGGRAKVRGRGLMHAHGLTTTVQVLRLGYLQRLLDETNPRLRARKEKKNGTANGSAGYVMANGMPHVPSLSSAND